MLHDSDIPHVKDSIDSSQFSTRESTGSTRKKGKVEGPEGWRACTLKVAINVRSDEELVVPQGKPEDTAQALGDA